MSRKVLFSLVCLSFLSLPAMAFAKPITLVVQLSSQQGTPAGIFWLEEWGKPIEEASKGDIKIEFVGGHAITRMEGAYHGIIDQAVDISEFSPNLVSKEVPYLTLMHLPFIAKDALEGTEMAYYFAETIPEYAVELEKDVHVLSYWALDRSAFLSTKTPIKTPADMKNKRVLVWGVGVMSDEVKSWGGDPIFTSAPDTYVALQRGMGDILFGQMSSFKSMKFFEVAKSIVVAPVEIQTLFLGINKDFWAELTQEQRDILTEYSGKDFAMKYAQFMYDRNSADLNFFKESGLEVITLTDEELEPFKKMSIEGTKGYWNRTLSQGGIKDTDALIKRVYDTVESFHNK